MPPPTLDEVRRRIARVLPALRERFGVRTLALFGSYACGEQTAASDLDLLVEFVEPPDLLQFVELAQQIEDGVGVRVDLFTRPMLKPRIAPRVLRDLVAL